MGTSDEETFSGFHLDYSRKTLFISSLPISREEGMNFWLNSKRRGGGGLKLEPRGKRWKEHGGRSHKTKTKRGR